MKIAKGIKVNLFASEKEFPELAKPVQMSFDTKGRLWVAVWPTLSALEAEGGDERQAPHPRGHRGRRQGRQDAPSSPTTCTARPASSSGNGGVLVAQAPDLMFLKDTKGDDKADIRMRVSARPRLGRHAPHLEQLRARSGRGALFPGRDVPSHAGRDAVRPAGPLRQRRRLPLRAADAEVRRLRRPTGSPIRTATSSTAGARISSSTAPAPIPTHGTLFSGHLDYPQQTHRPAHGLPAADPAVPRHRDPLEPPLPARRCQGNLLVANVIGFQGILQYKMEDKGRELRPAPRSSRLLSSTRSEFPPVRSQDRARRRHLLHRLAQPDHRPHAAQPARPQPRPDPRPHLSDHLRRPAARTSRRRSPANRSRSCSTCSRSPRTAFGSRGRIELGAEGRH